MSNPFEKFAATAVKFVEENPELAMCIAIIVNAGSKQKNPDDKMSLTTRQRKALDFIVAYMAANDGLAPSYQEIIDHLGIKSRANAHRLVLALEERGHIERIPHRSRAIIIKNREYA